MLCASSIVKGSSCVVLHSLPACWHGQLFLLLLSVICSYPSKPANISLSAPLYSGRRDLLLTKKQFHIICKKKFGSTNHNHNVCRPWSLTHLYWSPVVCLLPLLDAQQRVQVVLVQLQVLLNPPNRSRSSLTHANSTHCPLLPIYLLSTTNKLPKLSM